MNLRWIDPDRALCALALGALALALGGAALVLGVPDGTARTEAGPAAPPAAGAPRSARHLDPFAAPVAAAPAPARSPSAVSAQAPSAEPPPRAPVERPAAPVAFDPRSYRFTGTFSSGGAVVAVVAHEGEPGAPQRLYHVGDMLADARIVAIGARRLKLTCAGKQLVLVLRGEASVAATAPSTPVGSASPGR